MKLRMAIDRLTAAFALDIIDALRSARLADLDGAIAPAARSRAAKKTRNPRAARRAKRR